MPDIQAFHGVRYDLGHVGSLSNVVAPPYDVVDAEMQRLYAVADKIEWLYEPTFSRRWYPGFPERLQFATLTCAPWRWVLVAPCEAAPQGFVNVATGQTHPIVW